MPLPDLRALFNLPPERAVAYLEAKRLQLTGPYWELDGPEHSRVFTVANLAKLDVLADIKEAVQGALKGGQTERWFRAQLIDVLRQKGWWGPAVQVDPDTGEARIIQQGSLRRLQTIYRTNLQGAYMAGRHRQALEQADRAPFAQYLAVRDSRTRPSHAALHGKVFRLDSPEWSVISPPNGYNCFPGDAQIRADALVGLKTWYAGPMVELQTRQGHRLTVTANHPILAARGWIAAACAQEGDELLCATGIIDARLVGIVDHEQPPERADDLFQSLAREGLRVAPLAAHDFHGDALLRKGEIYIAGADGSLVDEGQTQAQELVGERQLRGGDARLAMDADIADRPAPRNVGSHNPGLAQDPFDVGGLGAGLLGDRSGGGGARSVERQGAPLEMRVSLIADAPSCGELPLDGGGIRFDALPLLPFSGGAVPQGDVAGAEFAVEHIAGAANPFRELLEANPGRVVADQVVYLRHFDFRGHVYDFQTSTGLILAGGVVVHNCRCRARYMSQDELDERGLKLAEDVRILERMPQQPVGDVLTGEAPERVTERGVSAADPQGENGKAILWADRGWDHLPGGTGAERRLIDRMMVRADGLGDGVRRVVLSDLARRGADFARAASAAPRAKQTVYIQAPGVPELAEQARAQAPDLDLSGLALGLDHDRVRHIIGAHGSARTEAPRGQRAVSAEDFARLPAVLAQARRVGPGTPPTAPSGARLVEVVAEVDGETWVVVLELRPKQGLMVPYTLWIRPH